MRSDSMMRWLTGGLLVMVGVAFWWRLQQDEPLDQVDEGLPLHVVDQVTTFVSEADFANYLAESQRLYGESNTGYGAMMPRATFSSEQMNAVGMDMSVEESAAAAPTRVSGTNVQVSGLDEPDRLKVGEQHLYYATEPQYYYYYDDVVRSVEPEAGLMEDEASPDEDLPVEEESVDGDARVDAEDSVSRSAPVINQVVTTIVDSIRAPEPTPTTPEAVTNVFTAWPVEELDLTAEVPATGELLLSGDRLIVLEQPNYYYYDTQSAFGVQAFDVSDASAPQASWELSFEQDQTYTAARLYDGELYLVLRQSIDQDTPCPVPLMEGTQIACDEIFRPRRTVPVDITYTVLKLDPSDGTVRDRMSFVGNSMYSVFYMSPQAMYLTYTEPGDEVGLMLDFLLTLDNDLLSAASREQLRRLQSYELSQEARMVELQVLMQRWQEAMDADEQKRVETEIENQLSDYLDQHIRELQTTGIVKINNESLMIDAVGSVPGVPLNQFSLDEYHGDLRVAVTIGESGMFFGGAQSRNDVIVLNQDLDETGAVRDLGEGERIYAARFIEDQAYVVTFRQTDPFYILDLSDPSDPRLTGELKIPGFSSYLHPLGPDRILGIGQEDWRVKLSLFDVSNPAEPKEIDKYTLDAYWSEVSETHHAFLNDGQFEAFFLPASSDGYVFGYADDKLSLERVVTGVQIDRAAFMDDYLYVIGQDQIVALDENTWQEANRWLSQE